MPEQVRFKIIKLKRKEKIFCYEVKPFIYEDDFDKVDELEISPYEVKSKL